MEYYWVIKINGRNLRCILLNDAILFQLHKIPESQKLWRQWKGQWLSRVSGEEGINK
jgi:hypothetical protein